MITKSRADFLTVLIGRLFQIVIMMVTLRVLTTLLSPEEMGSIYIFTSIYTFFILAFISPFGKYINKHTHAWHESGVLLSNLSIYYIYLLIIACLSVLIGYYFSQFDIVSGISLSVYLLLLFSFILFISFNQTVIPLLNMLYYRISFTFLATCTFLGILVFGYLFVILFGESAQNWLFGMAFSNALFGIIGYIVLKNRVSEKSNNLLVIFKKITKNNLKKILNFTIPLAVAIVFMWLQNSGYRIIIEKNIGLDFLGFFGVGMMVSIQISSVIESIVMQYLHPIYYKDITNTTLNKRKEAIDRLINTVLPIYFMLALFLTFLSKHILEILVDEKYYGAYIFMAFGVWVEFFRMSTNLFENISQSEMNTKKIIYPYIVGGITTITLIYFSSFELEYRLLLPLSLVLGGLVTVIAMFFSMKKLINFYISYKLLLVSFLMSIPYVSIYLIDIKSNIYSNLLIIFIFGMYFLTTVFFMYKKSLLYTVLK
jgi:O-antigen/teichoic acid export membrane protein